MGGFLIRHCIRDYKNAADPVVRGRYGNLGCAVGIFCNLLLFGVKLAIGLLSGSMAIFADAFNNLADMGSSVVVLLGFKLAERPADPEHPFGHGRMEYVSGFVVSVLIVLVGVELLKSSAGRIFAPEPLSLGLPAVLGLLFSAGVKLWMFFFNRRLGREIDSPALRATATDSLGDCAATLAVLLSAVVSAATTVNVDAWAGLLVAGLILYGGIATARDTVNLLLGAPPSGELVAQIEAMILKRPDFVGVHDLIVHSYGPGRTFVSAHVEVPCNLDIVRCHEEIDACEKAVGAALGIQLLLHMDPIATDDAEVNAARLELLRALREMDARLTIHDFRVVREAGHRALTFDLVLPVGFSKTREEMDKVLDAVARQIGPDCVCVVTYDVDLA